MENIKIVGIGGSLASHSGSLHALQTALHGAKLQGAEVKLFDIKELNLPFYDLRSNVVPADAKLLCDSIAEAQGLIWSAPLYHGTISGAFKNVLDWLELLEEYTPKYLTGKVVGLISTAGGAQALQAINTMEYVVRALRGFTLPMVVPIPRAWQVIDKGGTIKDASVEKQLLNLGKEVFTTARQLSGVTV